MRPNWIKVAAVLAGLWLVIGGAIHVIRRNRPTPEGIIAFVKSNPLDGSRPGNRMKVIESVASQVNRLDFDQRRELNRQRKLEPFWESLTPDERTVYLDRVLPTGFKQMMENFNKMEPEKRKQMVRRAVEDLRSHSGEQPPKDVDEAQMKKIVDQGLKTFYSDATIEAKMDALPLLEQLEQTIKWGH